MNKNLQRSLTYFIATVAAICTFIGLLLQFTKEVAWVVNYTVLLTLSGWMIILQFESNGIKQRVGQMETRFSTIERLLTGIDTRASSTVRKEKMREMTDNRLPVRITPHTISVLLIGFVLHGILLQ